jgi:hypothetical protein
MISFRRPTTVRDYRGDRALQWPAMPWAPPGERDGSPSTSRGCPSCWARVSLTERLMRAQARPAPYRRSAGRCRGPWRCRWASCPAPSSRAPARPLWKAGGPCRRRRSWPWRNRRLIDAPAGIEPLQAGMRRAAPGANVTVQSAVAERVVRRFCGASRSPWFF